MRTALWIFTPPLVACLFCHRADLLVEVPRPPVWAVLALCTSSTAWLWLAARGLFDDGFRWDWPLLAPGAGMVALGLSAAIALAVRERPVELLLPALHVAGIGVVALAPPPVPEESPALQRLRQAMSERRAYRREGLTVASLAADLGPGEAALRALINQQLGFRNFNDFLHHHRLQVAAARLDVEDLPILTIALASGCGSIGPFNRAFRQRFGMTPSEYRAGRRLAQPRPPCCGGGIGFRRCRTKNRPDIATNRQDRRR